MAYRGDARRRRAMGGRGRSSPPPSNTARVRTRAHRLLIMEVSALRDQLARMPTRGYIARAALGIIFSTSVVSTLLSWWLIAR